MESKIYNQKGESKGTVKLPAGIFDVAWNADLVHEVVRLMNSNARTPVANTKTRGEVRGGGKKPWKQKGTGRARHGSSRSPIWVGGGIAHGPRSDKNFSRKINKKARSKAFLAILSKKYQDGQILFVDSISFAAPKTKDALNVVSALSKVKGFEKLATKPKNVAIIALDKKSDAVSKSFRNFGNMSVEEFRNVNPVSLLNHTYLILANPAESLKALSAKTTK
jgi:large subunit ribosomal protein L4